MDDENRLGIDELLAEKRLLLVWLEVVPAVPKSEGAAEDEDAGCPKVKLSFGLSFWSAMMFAGPM